MSLPPARRRTCRLRPATPLLYPNIPSTLCFDILPSTMSTQGPPADAKQAQAAALQEIEAAQRRKRVLELGLVSFYCVAVSEWVARASSVPSRHAASSVPSRHASCTGLIPGKCRSYHPDSGGVVHGRHVRERWKHIKGAYESVEAAVRTCFAVSLTDHTDSRALRRTSNRRARIRITNARLSLLRTTDCSAVAVSLSNRSASSIVPS